MATATKYESGKICGVKYLFDGPGDTLICAAPTPEEAISIVVLLGVVGLEIEGLPPRHLIATNVIDFDNSKPYRIYVVEPGSVILTLFTNGKPPTFDSFDLKYLPREDDSIPAWLKARPTIYGAGTP